MSVDKDVLFEGSLNLGNPDEALSEIVSFLQNKKESKFLMISGSLIAMEKEEEFYVDPKTVSVQFLEIEGIDDVLQQLSRDHRYDCLVKTNWIEFTSTYINNRDFNRLNFKFFIPEKKIPGFLNDRIWSFKTGFPSVLVKREYLEVYQLYEGIYIEDEEEELEDICESYWEMLSDLGLFKERYCNQ